MSNYFFQSLRFFCLALLISSVILLFCYSGRYAWSLVTMLLALCAVSVSYLFPLFTFPDLTGKFSVGTAVYHLKEENRPEIHIQENSSRELIMQIWYPAVSDLQKLKAPYIPEVIASIQNSLKKSRYAPLGLVLNKFFPTHSHAVPQADIATDQEQYPVIIFSHGLGGICNFSTILVEELASHGYVVIGVNHTYSSYLTVFPDGRTIGRSPELDMSVMKLLKEKSPEAFAKLEREFNEWILDVQFVLHILEDNTGAYINPLLHKKLDLDRVGMYGHSLGGALAAELCRIDPRCKAGISLDGAVFDKTLEGEFTKPFMFILGVLLGDNTYPVDKALTLFNMTKSEWDQTIKKYKDAIATLCLKIGPDGYKITIKDAGHFAFTDISLLKPFWSYLFRFDIGSAHADIIHVTNRQVISFFDKYIKTTASSVTSGAAQEEAAAKPENLHM